MDGISACPLCKEQFENMSTLTTHMKDLHCSEPEEKMKKFGCDHCDYKGRSQSHLDCHVLTVHLGIFRSRCMLCDFATGCNRAFKQHVLSVHAKEKNLNGQVGDYTITRPSELKKNLYVYKKCPRCDYTACHSSTLTRHIKRTHNKIKDKSDVCDKKCPLCDYTATRSSHLTTHIKAVHDKLRDKHCPHCDFTTAHSSNLSAHIKTIHLKIVANKRPSM
jgi:KRAB domain-containing zinc finger protein